MGADSKRSILVWIFRNEQDAYEAGYPTIWGWKGHYYEEMLHGRTRRFLKMI